MESIVQRLLPDNWWLRDLDEIASISPIQHIRHPVFEAKGVSLSVKRDDLLDPKISGNKIYKLHGYLQQAINFPERPLVSFGGAFSNHIYALAAAAKELNLKSIGVIRGEEPQTLSPTLQDAKRCGMELHFISRNEYQSKHAPEFQQRLRHHFGEHLLIPEGGAGVEGVRGCMSLARGILNSVDEKPNVIAHACGTGTSVAGVVAGLALSPAQGIHVLGVSVLKGYRDLDDEVAMAIEALAQPEQDAFGFDLAPGPWSVNHDFHCGGYAKYPAYLAEFVAQFESDTQIPLDPVYTSKVMWALMHLTEQEFFPRGTNVVMVHSGGLQGRRGFNLSPISHE